MHSHISNKIDLLVQKPLKIAKEWLDQHPSKEIVFFLSYYLCKFSKWDPPFGASMRREKDSLYKGKCFYQKRESEVKKIFANTHSSSFCTNDGRFWQGSFGKNNDGKIWSYIWKLERIKLNNLPWLIWKRCFLEKNR